MNGIAVDPQIHFGKPCIAGTRIKVQDILELLSEGISFQDITQDYYPELAPEDIQACLQYAIALIASEDIQLASASA
ncbi:antitoxin [filamentous cyanobacterium CCP5]|nr:antitoxin [filamentous cyanobacterium CCP5]